MGKLGPRLGSRKNAKRWPKGQSSNSNPETKKYREKAAWMFFKENTTGKPGITKEALQKHDAIQGIGPEFEKLGLDEDRFETGTESSVNTFDTFASNYSNCSNISFSRFLSHFQSNSLLHKEMLAVLSAVTDVIKQNKGNESATEYFAALMSTLEAIESDTSIAATLSLLGMGLKAVPRNVLNIQFAAASKIFLDILVKYASTEEFLILRHCIHCLFLLLRAQEAAAWTNSSTTQVLDAVLSFITHSKPKVRKAAQHGVCALLKASEIMKGNNPPQFHPASPHIAKHCIDQLQLSSEPGSVTTILHVLTLLKDIFNHFTKTHAKTISESLLQLMTLKNVLITSCCLQTFHGLFVARPSSIILPGNRNAQIITALYDYKPPANDTQPTLAWLAVMQEAHLNLANTALDICSAILPKMIQTCTELWLSDKPEIISGSSHTFKILLQDCVGKMCENENNTKRYNDVIDQIIHMLHTSLSYQYLEAWYHILHLTAVLFEITGKSGNPRLADVIKRIADLRDSYNFASKNDAEYAIGAAIRVVGVETVLKLISISASETEINLKRTWLLPLLKDCVTGGTVSLFTNNLLPLIKICEQKMNESVGGKTYEYLIFQIWAILPSICYNATDIKDNFKNIAKLLGTTFTEKKDVRLLIMTALRRLITNAIQNDKEEDISELAKYAKNYLPLLLNQYTTKPSGSDDESHRRAAYETTKTYLQITKQELVHELYDRAISKLKDPNTDQFFKESVYDVIRLLMEYTDVDRIKFFYEICAQSVKENTNGKEQKKAYRFLQELCSSEKDMCKRFVLERRHEIQELLESSAMEVAKPSRTARIRCIIHLMQSHPDLMKSKFLEIILPEAVIYLKDLNTKCRSSAYQLLNMITEKFLESPEDLKNYIDMLMVGLGGTQKYCAMSMLALASVTYHHNCSLGMETIAEIFDHACNLVSTPTREVADAALAYIKVYITVIPSPTVTTNLTKLIDALCAMTDDCHRHFRQKVRDILLKLVRKYGMETISAMIPSPYPMLHKRLKNIHKLEKSKKKKRELKKSRETDSDEDTEFDAKRKSKSIEEILADSDDEFENTENEKPQKKKRTSRKEAWIQENEEILDLIDPAAARNISTTQPGALTSKAVPAAKSKDRGFKTAPDGRLIIAEEKGKDEEEEVRKKKKAPFMLHSDSEDDYEENVDVRSTVSSHVSGRKRKRSDNYDTMSVKSGTSSKYRAGGSGIHRPLKKPKADRVPGSEYKAPKAAGDIKKKGKPEPYAYVPLSRAVLNRRKSKKNATKFQSIVRGAQKGAKIGMKNRK